MRKRIWFALWVAALGWTGALAAQVLRAEEAAVVLTVLAGIPAVMATLALLLSLEFRRSTFRGKSLIVVSGVVALFLAGASIGLSAVLLFTFPSNYVVLDERRHERWLMDLTNLSFPPCAEALKSRVSGFSDMQVTVRFECGELDVDAWATRDGLRPVTHLDSDNLNTVYWLPEELDPRKASDVQTARERLDEIQAALQSGQLVMLERVRTRPDDILNSDAELLVDETYVTVDRRDPLWVRAYAYYSNP